MWAMREQEWIEHTASLRAQFDSELAYDGVSSAPPLRWSSTASRQNESSKQLTQEKECLAPLSIHPRIGSLVSSVLDPLFNQTNPPTQAPLSRVHQAHIDRWLMTELGLAVWTIKKWIWGCEVLAGEKRRAAVVVSSEEEAECDGLRRSESDCSVDSEKTLLDDDEQPMLKLGDTSCKPISETPLASPVLSNPSSGCVSYISLLLRESSICGSDLSSTHPIELLEQDDEGPWTPVNIDSLVTTDSA
ncbi:hypothetical protein DL96DRAFT_1598053 [Flagelloscypha sp. PMI_526]|nr:hypothetical protein DL96DRAFT_1598053 [Flagelloscypha sp. PMI_526]